MTAKVRQMTSNSSGNPVANQFIIYASDGNYFQSYNSVIAFKGNDGKITLDNYYWDYSRTTSKYRNQFLGEGVADTRAKIESGEYELADLN
jgi:ABC-type Fe3+ transport system substrate-binding protein